MTLGNPQLPQATLVCKFRVAIRTVFETGELVKRDCANFVLYRLTAASHLSTKSAQGPRKRGQYLDFFVVQPCLTGM